jgi:hypothetical protein
MKPCRASRITEQKKGQRFPLAAILAIVLAAMLSGVDNLMAVFHWGRRLTPKALHALGVPEEREKAPYHATYHYSFKEISLDHLCAAFGCLSKDEGAADQALEHVAIDGKRLRGSRHGSKPGTHILHAFAARLQASLGSLVVPPDSGEMVEVIELLKNLTLQGAVVTGDAAFTFDKVVEAIRDGGGDYFLFVKGNQPETQTEISHAFGDDFPLQGGL